MRALPIRVALVVLVMAPGARAQEVLLTEERLLSMIVRDNPRVRAIEAPVDIARAEAEAAGRWPNPRLSFTRETAAGVAEHLTTVSQPLPITGSRAFDVRAATALLDAAFTRAADQTRRLRADARLAFAALAAAQIRERELARSHGRVNELAAVLARREAAGDAAGFDRLRAEREALDVELDRASAATDRVLAQAALAGLLVSQSLSSPGNAVRVAATEDIVAARVYASIPAVEEMVDHAERTRGELLAFEHEIASAEFAGRATDRRLIPEPELTMGTKSSSAGDVGSIVALQARVPLFDRLAPERARARGRASLARAQADVFRADLRATITALRAVVVERRAAAERYRADATAKAAELERIADVSYQAGERGILELLDAYRSTASARLRQVALDAAVREAEIELEFVSGWEIP